MTLNTVFFPEFSSLKKKRKTMVSQTSQFSFFFRTFPGFSVGKVGCYKRTNNTVHFEKKIFFRMPIYLVLKFLRETSDAKLHECLHVTCRSYIIIIILKKNFFDFLCKYQINLSQKDMFFYVFIKNLYIQQVDFFEFLQIFAMGVSQSKNDFTRNTSQTTNLLQKKKQEKSKLRGQI